MSNESKHTPGPWHVGEKGTGNMDDPDTIPVLSSDSHYIAEVWADVKSKPAEANASLIAAAPELLEALKVASRIIGHPDDDMSIHFAKVIAKAEGAMSEIKQMKTTRMERAELFASGGFGIAEYRGGDWPQGWDRDKLLRLIADANLAEELLHKFGKGPHIFTARDGTQARCGGKGVCPACDRDDQISQLQETISTLRTAIAPFAALAEKVNELRHEDDSTCPWRLKAGDIRAAAAALNGSHDLDDRSKEDEARKLPDILCPVHASLDSRNELKPFDNCIACIRNERDELRATIEDLKREVSGHDSSLRLSQATIEKQRTAMKIAEDALRELMDDDPCQFDHHGFCQTHGGKPCPMAKAREAIKAVEKFDDEKKA